MSKDIIPGAAGRAFAAWWRDTAGVAIAEFALIFPLLMTLLMGVYQVGNAVSVNQKAIAASQIVADLVARNSSVDDDSLDEAVRAGELAIAPYDTGNMGVDIVSLEFDTNNNAQIVWRETRGMDPDSNAVTKAGELGSYGDGVIVVTVSYTYNMGLFSTLIDHINMKEATFTRGRRTAVVARN